MTRQGDVPAIMARVRSTLDAAEATADGAAGVIPIESEGDAEIYVAQLRHMADIDLEFASGSDRPGVGPAIRFTKRLVRRSLRWYLAPMMRQQSEFNHATLDMIERLRLRVAALTAELEQAQSAEETPPGRRT